MSKPLLDIDPTVKGFAIPSYWQWWLLSGLAKAASGCCPTAWSSVLSSAICCAHFFCSVLQIKQFLAPPCSLCTALLLLCWRSDWSMMWDCFLVKFGGQIRPCRACSLECCCCTVIVHAAVGGEVENAFSWLLCEITCSEGMWECQQQKKVDKICVQESNLD